MDEFNRFVSGWVPFAWPDRCEGDFVSISWIVLDCTAGLIKTIYSYTFRICYFRLFSIGKQIVYIHHFCNDFLTIVPAIYSTSLFIGLFMQYLALLRQRPNLVAFMNNLTVYTTQRTMLCYDIRKNISNICMCISVINRYNSDAMQLIEHNITKYLTFFVRFSLVTAIFYITVPAILQFEAIVSDAVTNQTFEAPFHDMYDTIWQEFVTVSFKITIYQVLFRRHNANTAFPNLLCGLLHSSAEHRCHVFGQKFTIRRHVHVHCCAERRTQSPATTNRRQESVGGATLAATEALHSHA